jgi:hypothetical protein
VAEFETAAHVAVKLSHVQAHARQSSASRILISGMVNLAGTMQVNPCNANLNTRARFEKGLEN